MSLPSAQVAHISIDIHLALDWPDRQTRVVYLGEEQVPTLCYIIVLQRLLQIYLCVYTCVCMCV